MTLAMMDEAGVFFHKNNNLISIAQQQYKRKTLYIEADWSSASYWFSMAALSQDAEIELIGLKSIANKEIG
jgi:3-phosphoshikimate 1-carboxyvinyltransferase